MGSTRVTNYASERACLPGKCPFRLFDRAKIRCASTVSVCQDVLPSFHSFAWPISAGLRGHALSDIVIQLQARLYYNTRGREYH